MSLLGKILAILAALVFIIGVALGDHVYKWESITWPVIVIFWVISSWTWEALWKDSQR